MDSKDSKQRHNFHKNPHPHPHRHRKEQDPMIALSKALSKLLRHDALKLGLKPERGGFVPLADVLALPNFKKFTVEDVRSVVESNEKQRFTLEELDCVLWIRANQGHTFPFPQEQEELLLERITADGPVPETVVHGTYSQAWEKIRRKGLSRMRRNHIHFAAGEPGDPGVVSGFRASAHILIYIDVHKALGDGLIFFRSQNNVILCPGNAEGILEPKYFLKVIDRKKGAQLL